MPSMPVGVAFSLLHVGAMRMMPSPQGVFSLSNFHPPAWHSTRSMASAGRGDAAAMPNQAAPRLGARLLKRAAKIGGNLCDK